MLYAISLPKTVSLYFYDDENDSLNNKFSNLSSGTTLFVNVTQPHFELQDSDIKIDTALTDF
jgi:hypothetical protein